MDASAIMSTPENVQVVPYYGVGTDPTEYSVVDETTDVTEDYTLSSRIYDYPEVTVSTRDSFQDLGEFAVTPRPDYDMSTPFDAASNMTEVPRETAEEVSVWGGYEDSRQTETTTVRRGDGTRYLIQLGALPSEASANREWTRIERRHPELVRNQFPIIFPVEVDSQAGTIYRLRTGPIDEITTARSLCAKFRSAGQDCFVVKFDRRS